MKQAVYDSVKEFIEKGHKNIAFVVGPLHEPKNTLKKLRGYQRALKNPEFLIMRNLWLKVIIL